MTLSDLEWSFHASRAIFAVAELLVIIMTSYDLKLNEQKTQVVCLRTGQLASRVTYAFEQPARNLAYLGCPTEL